MDAGGPPSVGINPYAAPEAADLPPAPVDAYGFRSATPLANAINVVMALIVLVQVGKDAICFAAIGLLKKMADVDRTQLVVVYRLMGIVIIASGVLLLTSGVLFCFFMPRANRNARAFGATPMTFTPGWSAGVFFVPIWSLYKPYRAMKEIWQGSNPEPTESPWSEKVPAFFGWWWALYLIDNAYYQMERIFGSFQDIFKSGKDAEGLIASLRFVSAGSILTIASAILAGMVVRAVARRQDEKQRRITAAAAP